MYPYILCPVSVLYTISIEHTGLFGQDGIAIFSVSDLEDSIPKPLVEESISSAEIDRLKAASVDFLVGLQSESSGNECLYTTEPACDGEPHSLEEITRTMIRQNKTSIEEEGWMPSHSVKVALDFHMSCSILICE